MSKVKKNIIYVSGAFSDTSPVGIRYLNFKNYLEKNYNLLTINLRRNVFFFSGSGYVHKLLRKIFMRLPIFPDSTYLLLFFYKRALKRALLKHNNECEYVLLQVLPFSFLFLSKYIKKISPHTKVIIDLSDPVSINLSFNSFSKMKQRRILKLENQSISFSDKLIVLNEELKDFYSKFFISSSKVTVIEQGFNNFKNDYSIPSEMNIKKHDTQLKLLYAGHFYKKIREPFELFKVILESESRFFLSIYGTINTEFLPPNSKDFYYSKAIPQKELFKVYQIADVIVFIDNENSYQIPGKIFEILATQKPILCITNNINSPSMTFLKRYKGIFYSENKKGCIKQTLNEIKRVNKFIWERNVEEYSWPILLRKLDKLIV